MCLSAIIFVCVIFIEFSNGQTCLSSPPELQWNTATGVFEGELTFGAETFTINDVTFTTRAHNGRIPSPTLRFKRGQEYHLKLINTLSPEPASTLHNEIKDLQWTNIHTHGLHISGESPADNIFDKINGGEDHLYIYNFPCDHAGGLSWYHPHVHGSTAVQVGGGAVGAIIVEEDARAEGLPLWLISMEEIVLVIQHLELNRLRGIARRGSDPVFNFNGGNSDFWIINGEYQPDICLTTGKWKRFRIVNSDMRRANEYTIDAAGGDTSSCNVYLISKDGVLIHGQNNQVPREITTRTMYFTVASRAEVAVKCTQSGSYSITTSAINGANTVIANIVVSDPFGTEADIQLTPFHPIRPRYLHSLIDVDPAKWISDGGEYNTETVSIDRIAEGGFGFNNQLFAGPTTNIFTNPLRAGSLQQWTLSRNNNHPLHIHVNHFQILSLRRNDIGSDPNWTEIGDWLDIINEEATIRFVADRFGGHVIMHCHILEHEDAGTMALTFIEGGCDAFGNDISPNSGLPCDKQKNCNIPFIKQPTTAPTLIPVCRASGAQCSENSDCCSNRCRGNGFCR